MLILSIHALARTELEARARSALTTAQRAFTADDAEPSDELRTEVIGLIDRTVRELSSDVDAVYEKHCSRMKGKWPTLEEPRQRALDLATSDLDIDLLARRRRRVPLGDALKAPRYEACREHWLKARGLADAEARLTTQGESRHTGIRSKLAPNSPTQVGVPWPSSETLATRPALDASCRP